MKTAESLIIGGGDLSNDLHSEARSVYYLKQFSIHFKWSGTPNGIIYIEGNNSGKTEDTWNLISDSFINVNGPGDFLLEVDVCCYKNMRVAYDRISGSGTLDAEFIGKGQ